MRSLRIVVNGIEHAPAFVHLPYSLPLDLSDDGRKVVGLYGPFQSPYWTWSKHQGMTNIDGVGFNGAISGDGRIVGGAITKDVETEYGVLPQERAALWTRRDGWKSISDETLQGCDIYQTTLYDLDHDGSTAVGLAFANCTDAFAFKWTEKTGVQRLHRISDRASRANAVSGNGRVVGGWEEIPEAFGFRVGSLWVGDEQMLLADPEPANVFGYVGEVTAVNRTGSIAIGNGAGVGNKDGYKWTRDEGVVSLGHYPKQVCYSYYDWLTGELIEACEDRETFPYSMSHDGKVITGSAQLLHAGVQDAAIHTRGLGWMLLGDFLASQGVLEVSRWHFQGAHVSGDGKTLIGTAFPLAADYWHGFRLELDQVFVCHDKRRGGKTMRVGFPEEMDGHLAHGDAVGLCPGDAPL